MSDADTNSKVRNDQQIAEGISRGLADMRAGRTVSHKDAMSRLRATVAAEEKKSRTR